jgi:predicted RNA-binding Zn ribbon-like protein
MSNDLGPYPWRHMPADREPAPGALRLVEAFVNTVNHERGDDAIATVDGLRVWLAEFDLGEVAPAVTAADVEAAVAVREAIRALLRANGGAELDAGAAAVLARTADRGGLSVRIDRGGSRLVARAGGFDAVLGRLLATIHDALRDGTFQRLRSCRNARCSWAFYDRSRNLSATWCSMSICGNRTKVRGYRSRHAREVS